MKIENTKQIWGGPVNCRYEVIFTATKEEVDELKDALEIVNKWKDQALQKVPAANGSDWVMFDYLCHQESVVIGIEAGACG